MSYDPSGGLTGWDLTGFHEGHDTECWRRLRRPRDERRGLRTWARSSAPGSRSGRPTPRPCRLRRRLQLLERRGALHAPDPRSSGSGRCSSKGPAQAALQVRGAGRRRRVAAQGRSDGAVRRGCSAHCLGSCIESQYVWGDDDWMWYRGQKAMHAEPMSVYEVHVGSWRTGAHLPRAGQRTGRVRAAGRATRMWNSCPSHSIPFEGSWGYHVTGYFAPMSKFGSPDEFRHLVGKLHQAGIGVIGGLGAWALCRPTRGRCSASTAPRCTSTRIRSWAGTWTGAPTSSTSAETSEEFPDLECLLLAGEILTSTGYASTAVDLRCSTWTTPGEARQWVPNKYGGNENLEAVELLQRTNPARVRTRARQRHGRRGVHLLAGRHAGHRLRRPRLRVQAEHGLDERLAAAPGPRAGFYGSSTTTR